MTNDKNPTMSQILNLLNDWRHLPFYSLERRSAPFFAVFIREVLSNQFDREMHEILVPEFPLRIGALYIEEERKRLRPVPSPGQSYNVDYVAFAKDKSMAYLVELKTDLSSLRPKQSEYLCRARKRGLLRLVEGVIQLAQDSKKYKSKYAHLLYRLSAPGIDLVPIRSPDQNFPDTKVVFIQPKEHKSDRQDFEHIYFKEVANIVEPQGDLGALFANCLRQWTTAAGSRDPKDIPLPS